MLVVLLHPYLAGGGGVGGLSYGLGGVGHTLELDSVDPKVTVISTIQHVPVWQAG